MSRVALARPKGRLLRLSLSEVRCDGCVASRHRSVMLQRPASVVLPHSVSVCFATETRSVSVAVQAPCSAAAVMCKASLCNRLLQTAQQIA